MSIKTLLEDWKSNWLLKANVKEVPHIECKDIYNQTYGSTMSRGLPSGIGRTQLCALNRKTFADTCQGEKMEFSLELKVENILLLRRFWFSFAIFRKWSILHLRSDELWRRLRIISSGCLHKNVRIYGVDRRYRVAVNEQISTL